MAILPEGKGEKKLISVLKSPKKNTVDAPALFLPQDTSPLCLGYKGSLGPIGILAHIPRMVEPQYYAFLR